MAWMHAGTQSACEEGLSERTVTMSDVEWLPPPVSEVGSSTSALPITRTLDTSQGRSSRATCDMQSLKRHGKVCGQPSSSYGVRNAPGGTGRRCEPRAGGGHFFGRSGGSWRVTIEMGKPPARQIARSPESFDRGGQLHGGLIARSYRSFE